MKIKIILITILGGVLLTGCKKDFLEKKPLSSFSEIDVFVDASLLDTYVLGTYRGMGHPFGGEGFEFTEMASDNGYTRHGGDGDRMREYTRGEIGPQNGEAITRNKWAGSYNDIRRVNVFFEKIAGSPIDVARLTTAKGEMRFLRAFFYLQLLKWYGGVPLITASFPLGQGDYGVARSTADEVAAFIVQQCDSAITELPAFAAVQRGRISKEAAMALKGRTLLYAASPLFNPSNDQAKWILARDANKAVMDVASIPNLSSPARYHDIFNGKNNEEIILARYFTDINAHGGGSWGSNLWLYPNGLNGWGMIVPTQNLVDAYEMTNGKPISDPTSGYDQQNPYTNRDQRLSESILFNGASFFDPVSSQTRPMEYWEDANSTTIGGRESVRGPSPHNASLTRYNFRKYTDEGKPADASGANENTSPFVYFRKAEFYLNYAEAQIALGAEGEARTALGVVRARVGMPAVTETGAALMTKYQNERRVEMAFEELRLDDIRRWKIGPTALGVPARGVRVLRNNTTMQYDYNLIVDGARKWDDKMYLLPIPFTEIQKSNGRLVQNPGY
ncbi:MAG: RagB/SusD family nutrient uptake outer membrane protein [Chitinophagaceae bacterium]|nr:MAG: RagB/SusD family nutrient uptake outer membrane protein [Chitinophagaceae bacterium]